MKKTILLTMFVTAICLTAKAQYTKLHDFGSITNDGWAPYGSLISDGTFFYGMTFGGGTSDSGTVFKIKHDGTGYSKLFDFTGIANGRSPFGSLISDGTFLYGMTVAGGSNNEGSVFKIKPDGTGYAQLLDCDPPNGTNSRNPYGSLIFDSIFLYGMSGQGGVNDSGTVFKIKPDGTGYLKLFDFDGLNGSRPNADIISDGTFLYGTTWQGGTNNGGVIFKIKPDGTAFTKLHDFDSISGNHPPGSLIFDGTFLYGMTNSGGTDNDGVIFKIKPDGTGYAGLLDFTGDNGRLSNGSLIYDGTFLYGATYQGGASDWGVLFKIKPDGTGYVKLLDFDGANGLDPSGSLISDGIFLYGMTVTGGINGDGVIFKNCIAQYSTSYDSIQNIFTLDVDSTITALATGYHWDFGDGESSILALPSHTYTLDSVYNICMKIYLASGDTCVYCHTIGKDSLGNIIRNEGFQINVRNTNSSSGIFQNLSAETNITIFPNPTSGIFQIANANYEVSSIEVYNLLGERIHRHIGAFSNLQIDLSCQPNGIYFLNVKTGKGILSKKLIINK